MSNIVIAADVALIVPRDSQNEIIHIDFMTGIVTIKGVGQAEIIK